MRPIESEPFGMILLNIGAPAFTGPPFLPNLLGTSCRHLEDIRTIRQDAQRHVGIKGRATLDFTSGELTWRTQKPRSLIAPGDGPTGLLLVLFWYELRLTEWANPLHGNHPFVVRALSELKHPT